MEPIDIDNERYVRAERRVRAIAGFYRHLMFYVLINLLLLGWQFFNLGESGQFLKFDTFSTAVYWGIGLAFHAVGVFGGHAIFGRNWEKKKIEQIMERDKKQRWE